MSGKASRKDSGSVQWKDSRVFGVRFVLPLFPVSKLSGANRVR